MPGSFSIALSGLNAASTALNVVGNNLANLNTTGFKSSAALFHDLMASLEGSAQVGGGVSTPLTQRDFSQGSIQLAGGAFNAAIEGNGFFMVHDSSGHTLYTRAGDFHLDANGNLVTSTGEFVQGWNATGGVVNSSGAVGNVAVPANALANPSATTAFTMNLNLDASAVNGAASGTFSAPIQVIDSLGNTHTLTVTFTKQTAANSWKYEIFAPGEDLASGTAGKPTSVGTGTLTFDASGKLTSPAPPNPISVTVTGLADGAADLKMNWNIYDSSSKSQLSQFASASALSGSSQDGIAAAQVTQVAVANGGQIVAQYSNGARLVVGQLAMASISNPDSLVAVGNNNFQLGAGSATPVVGASGTGSRGTIEAGALEASNVDIAQEFTNLIVYQRSYQANSRVITTLDELTQDLLNMKR